MNTSQFLSQTASLIAEGASVMEAIARVLDEYLTTARRACEPGCAACCHQMVGIGDLEWLSIESHLEGLRRYERREIVRHSRKMVERWSKYVQTHGVYDKKGEVEEDVYAEWLGEPCPFLKDGGCLIYEARPPDCRLHLSYVKCQTAHESGKDPAGPYAGPAIVLAGDDPRFYKLVPKYVERPIHDFMMKSQLYR